MDNKLKSIVLEQLNEINSVFEKDKRIFGGYSATEYANNTAPEDYNEDRTDWRTLQSRADDMYYMLNYIENKVSLLKKVVEMGLDLS